MKYTLDATDKKLGRVASEAASMLMGKNTTEYTRNAIPQVEVEIINTSKAAISLEKMEEKQYAQFSGYPGGLRHESLKQVVDKKGYSEAFRRAVYGMLPSNKLRSRMMKNLKISE